VGGVGASGADGGDSAVAAAGGAGSGSPGCGGGAAAASDDLSQIQLHHDSWWPSRDGRRTCAYASSQRPSAADTSDHVWFAGGGCGYCGGVHRWCPLNAPGPRNCAGSCSYPCHCKTNMRKITNG